MALTNNEIEEILRGKMTSFLGVFSCDTIPSEVNSFQQFSLISNLSKINEVGSHFITIIKNEDNVYFLDPLGLKCSNKNILQKFCNYDIWYNVRQIQDFSSDFCAHFCMLFCLDFDHRSKSRFFHTKNLYKNDKLCLSYLNEYNL